MTREIAPTNIPPTDQVRQEFPFVRPPLTIKTLMLYAIPAIGAGVYIRDLAKIKGISVKDMFKKPFSKFDLKAWLTLGVSTWPEPRNIKEANERKKTATQDGSILGYHMGTTILIAFEIAKTMQS